MSLMPLYIIAHLKRIIHPFQTWIWIKMRIEESTFWHQHVIDAEYQWLVDKCRPNTTLIDIGAYEGDTPMFFSLFHNIVNIIAFEPDKTHYKRAKQLLFHESKNPHVNKVTLYNEAVGKDHTFDDNIMYLNPKDHENIRCISLNDALRLTTTSAIVIKCDCEGGEYEIFTQEAKFRNVYAIQLEYHRGPKQIPEILKDKGFKIMLEPSKPSPASDKSELGYIYAWR